MPPRHITLAIVAFWVAMSGCLLYFDLWPRLRPGEPPPYVIDLVDEARIREAKNHWFVLQQGREIGYANTSVDYRGSDDTFRLKGEFKIRSPESRGDPKVELYSWYRVTRIGELREVAANLKIRPGFIKVLPVAIEASIHGAVEDGKLRLRYKSPFGDGELEPVPVANRGSVLNTMAPLNRLRGLAPGRRWQIALIDPMSAIPILSRANPKPRILNAEVKEETIEWPAGPGDANPLEVPCYVIYYRGEDDTRARTWVRQSDEMVLQQEASFGDLQLTLRRDLER